MIVDKIQVLVGIRLRELDNISLTLGIEILSFIRGFLYQFAWDLGFHQTHLKYLLVGQNLSLVQHL